MRQWNQVDEVGWERKPQVGGTDPLCYVTALIACGWVRFVETAIDAVLAVFVAVSRKE